MNSQKVTFPVRSIPLTISAQAATEILDGEAWGIVCRFLNAKGSYYQLMNDEEHKVVRLLADGFGDLRGSDLPQKTINEMLWDWSHVRDSSDEGIARMVAAIRQFVNEKTA